MIDYRKWISHIAFRKAREMLFEKPESDQSEKDLTVSWEEQKPWSIFQLQWQQENYSDVVFNLGIIKIKL